MSDVKYYAIIVGGGSGRRMGSETPKQFMLLKGRPVIMYSIETFHSCKQTPEIIVVLPDEFHDYWRHLCTEYHFHLPHLLVSGGEQRYHSVRNGLKQIKGSGVTAIHDAVRPCVSPELVTASFQQALESGSAVAAVKSRDSIRQITPTGSTWLNRDEIYLIQTPQVFQMDLLSKAYLQEYNDDFTDDASVVEKYGGQIKLIEGDRQNLKITYPEDIPIAELYLGQRI